MSEKQNFEQNGSIFGSARSRMERFRQMLTGMDSRQLATTARIVALALLIIAIYNSYIFISHIS